MLAVVGGGERASRAGTSGVREGGDDGRKQEESNATRPFVDLGNKRTLNSVTRVDVINDD